MAERKKKAAAAGAPAKRGAANERRVASLKRSAAKEPQTLIPNSEILMLLRENSERDFKHTTYERESRRFHLLMQGDMEAVEESVWVLDSEMQGKLSSDPLRNFRYLFIVNTGLATRYAIEAGVPQEMVYSCSDLYIQQADVAQSIKKIQNLNREFWTKMVEMVQRARATAVHSRIISDCLDYIDAHFTSRITLSDLAAHTGMSATYLAALFKKEMGETFVAYLMRRRIDTARALLIRTDYTYSQIAYSLAFCSQSHFIDFFRRTTGYTPRQYRMQFFNENISARKS
ncbi:MAG: helix-turn-helix transcriptional regulator [Clostridiales bacterium]|nr:helix-turn-helix transcriptional regulator [Clostridiales bacterium]